MEFVSELFELTLQYAKLRVARVTVMFKPKTYRARALLSLIIESSSFGKSKMERFCDYPKDAWLPESICPYILGLEVLKNIAPDTSVRLRLIQ